MRIFIAIIVGLLGGFILGVALSSFIGILGMTILSNHLGLNTYHITPHFYVQSCYQYWNIKTY